VNEKLKKAFLIATVGVVVIGAIIGGGYLMGRRSARDKASVYQERIDQLADGNRLLIEGVRSAGREIQGLEEELRRAIESTRLAEESAQRYKDLADLQYGIIEAFEAGDRKLGEHAQGARDSIGNALAGIDEILEEIKKSKDQ
jgi:phage shock protein A